MPQTTDTLSMFPKTASMDNMTMGLEEREAVWGHDDMAGRTVPMVTRLVPRDDIMRLRRIRLEDTQATLDALHEAGMYCNMADAAMFASEVKMQARETWIEQNPDRAADVINTERHRENIESVLLSKGAAFDDCYFVDRNRRVILSLSDMMDQHRDAIGSNMVPMDYKDAVIYGLDHGLITGVMDKHMDNLDVLPIKDEYTDHLDHYDAHAAEIAKSIFEYHFGAREAMMEINQGIGAGFPTVNGHILFDTTLGDVTADAEQLLFDQELCHSVRVVLYNAGTQPHAMQLETYGCDVRTVIEPKAAGKSLQEAVIDAEYARAAVEDLDTKAHEICWNIEPRGAMPKVDRRNIGGAAQDALRRLNEQKYIDIAAKHLNGELVPEHDVESILAGYKVSQMNYLADYVPDSIASIVNADRHRANILELARVQGCELKDCKIIDYKGRTMRPLEAGADFMKARNYEDAIIYAIDHNLIRSIETKDGERLSGIDYNIDSMRKNPAVKIHKDAYQNNLDYYDIKAGEIDAARAAVIRQAGRKCDIAMFNYDSEYLKQQHPTVAGCELTQASKYDLQQAVISRTDREAGLYEQRAAAYQAGRNPMRETLANYGLPVGPEPQAEAKTELKQINQDAIWKALQAAERAKVCGVQEQQKTGDYGE